VSGIPKFIYGTAWKENETERLTRLAIDNGFRAGARSVRRLGPTGYPLASTTHSSMTR